MPKIAVESRVRTIQPNKIFLFEFFVFYIMFGKSRETDRKRKKIEKKNLILFFIFFLLLILHSFQGCALYTGARYIREITVG